MATMTAYWREFPPLHVMVAIYLEAGEKDSKPEQQEASLADLLSQIPQV
jgi:hypothetical protein